MNAISEAKKLEVTNESTTAVKPANTVNVRKAVTLGKELSKQLDTSKADVARKMYESISDEPREVIVQAFVDGAGLTPKGAQTYFYNCRRRKIKTAS
ncbi:MAG: hypothetical protein AB7Q04_13480 [Steroidobacteraceae bacterium]